MTTKVLLLVAILGCVAGCDNKDTKQAQAPQKPASFRETIVFTSVTPMADGGAYVVGFDSGLWYVRGSEAVKVHFTDLPTDISGVFFGTLAITPLLDGSALAHSIVDKSFWHLREATAERVTEVPALSGKPISGRVSAFPLYVAERQKRIEAERELEDRPRSAEPPSE
jgi:hypothetical protein